MPSKRAPTSDQLRSAIDRGRAGDKVDFPDPAAVPLGADEEAGGFPPTASKRRRAYREELTRSVSQRPAWRVPSLSTVIALAAVVWSLCWR